MTGRGDRNVIDQLLDGLSVATFVGAPMPSGTVLPAAILELMAAVRSTTGRARQAARWELNDAANTARLETMREVATRNGADLRQVWVAERDACVDCLGMSGQMSGLYDAFTPESFDPRGPMPVYEGQAVERDVYDDDRLDAFEADYKALRAAWDREPVDGPKYRLAQDHYVGIGYRRINHAARHNVGHELTPEDAQAMLFLDRALDRHGFTLDARVPLWRGVNGDYANELLNLEVGARIVDDGYTSVTHQYNTARAFANLRTRPDGSLRWEGAMLQVVPDPATPFLPIGLGEGELLFPRGTAFEVIAVDTEDRIVKVRMLNRDELEGAD